MNAAFPRVRAATATAPSSDGDTATSQVHLLGTSSPFFPRIIDPNPGDFEPELPPNMYPEHAPVTERDRGLDGSPTNSPDTQRQRRPARDRSPADYERSIERPRGFRVLDDANFAEHPAQFDEVDTDVIDRGTNLYNVGPSRYNENGSHTLYAVFLIVNAALGAGLLNFPKAFDQAGGIVVAVSVQTGLLVFIIVALLILAFCADMNMAETIQEAMRATAGLWGRRLSSVLVIVYCFGTTITFLIIIGDQFDRALASLYGHTFCHYWYMNRVFTMSVSSVLFILPLCFSKKIDFLRVPSALGVLAIFYIVFLIIYEYHNGDYPAGPIKTKPGAWTDVFLVVPDICFSYQCHVSVIPIYSCMKHRTLKSFSFASIVAIVICAACYTLAGCYGYMTFGSMVNDDILMSYSAKRPMVLAAMVAMALKTVTTYPMLLFCGREAFRTLFREIFFRWRGYDVDEWYERVVVASVWFVLSLLLALAIPNIGDIIKLLGSLAAVFIFVLPGVGLFQYAERSDPSRMLKRTWVYLVTSFAFNAIGFFLFGVVFTQAVQYNLHSHPEPVQLCYD